MRILIVEDDPELGSAIARRLRAVGYAADEASDIAEGEYLHAVSQYDLVILDRNLPDGDAIDQLAAWRRRGITTPVIFLTARDRVEDRVEGLHTGADDYLVKPFAMEELIARVGAVIRRESPPQPTHLQIGDLTVETSRRQVWRGNVLLPLRPKEYCVLHLLATRAGAAVSRADIIEHCWDMNYEPLSNVEETIIASLRRKLGKPPLIHTVRGGGYLLEESN